MKYINVIPWMVLCWLIFCFGMVFLTFSWRKIQSIVQLRNKKHLARLEVDMLLFLYEEKLEAELIQKFNRLKGYKRQLFLGLLARMNAQFIGQINIKLKRLFVKFRPYHDAPFKTAGLKSMASIRNPFSSAVLKNTSEIISDWEQINMHNNLVRYKVELPNLSNYLTGENTSLHVFCLRLMRIYREEGACEKLIPFLYHPSENVKYQTLLTLEAIFRADPPR